ncbi:hypothetical protein [Microbaculum marinum]|uniref:Lipoprotein n=1 Tax=Microbaculum marinum TaxID=1764581 RepID=A0AAW9RHK8_9HYPH
MQPVRIRRRYLGPAAVAIAAVLAAQPAVAAKGGCNTPKTHYRTTETSATTTSTEYVLLPKSRIVFRQRGDEPGCVVVRLSALPRADYIMEVRPVIDGSKTATPASIQFEYDSPGYLSPRSFGFVFPKVAPGRHVLKFEWRTVSAPSHEARMYGRTITVQHQ